MKQKQCIRYNEMLKWLNFSLIIVAWTTLHHLVFLYFRYMKRFYKKSIFYTNCRCQWSLYSLSFSPIKWLVSEIKSVILDQAGGFFVPSWPLNPDQLFSCDTANESHTQKLNKLSIRSGIFSPSPQRMGPSGAIAGITSSLSLAYTRYLSRTLSPTARL